jgi:hypothetical protein
MFSHVFESLRQFFTAGSPLELSLVVLAIAAIGVGLRMRIVAAARKPAAGPTAGSSRGPADRVFGPSDPPVRHDDAGLPPIDTFHDAPSGHDDVVLSEMPMTTDLPPLRDDIHEPSSVPRNGSASPETVVTGTAVTTFAPPSYDRPVDDAIVFPSGHGHGDYGDFHTSELPPLRSPVADLPEAGAIASILSDGLDDLASGGDRFAEAVRERPIQYMIGALAAGFAAGVMFPLMYGQARLTRLLEKVIETNEQLKHVRYADRFEYPQPDVDQREREKERAR